MVSSRHCLKNILTHSLPPPQLQNKVDEALRFMKAIGVDVNSPTFASTDFFVAHEALLLPYEEALSRVDSTSGDHYACSGHMVCTYMYACVHVYMCMIEYECNLLL